MAKKSEIESAEIDALAKLFCSGPGAHLGVIVPRPFKVKKPEFWETLKGNFVYLRKDWSYGELEVLIREATTQKRMVVKPSDLVEGKTPQAKPESSKTRNLMLSKGRLDERLYWHPLLKERRMPVAVLVRSPRGQASVEHIADGSVGEFVDSFTGEQLLAYWTEKVSGSEGGPEVFGALLWVAQEYGLSTALHAIDRFSESLLGERDVLVRLRKRPFDLRPFVLEIERERGEASKWLSLSES